MIDRCGALALPKGAALPSDWPVPAARRARRRVAAWRERHGLPTDGRPAVAIGPGAVGPGKAWPPEHYAELARRLTRRRHRGLDPRRTAGSAARRGPRRGDRSAGARPDRPRPARGDPGAGGRRCGHHQRFRADAYCGGARHPDGRDFRADQPPALGAAQPARRGSRAARTRRRTAHGQRNSTVAARADVSVDRVLSAVPCDA